MDPETLLASYVALPIRYEPTGECVAWVESRDERCGKTADHLLCPAHIIVARRRLAKDEAKRAARHEKAARRREVDLPKWRARLAQIDKRIAVLDPPVLTTDRAAYGGDMHASIVRGQRSATSDSRVEEMAKLLRERQYLLFLIGADL